MARNGWHILTEPGGVTVSRAVPVRWDVAAETVLPETVSPETVLPETAPNAARPLRVAHQVRQDVWRALRRQRGFAPAVRAVQVPDGLAVRAGGRVAAPHDAARLNAVIAALLEMPTLRRRWLASARPRTASTRADR